MPAAAKDSWGKLNRDEYVELLKQLIGETEHEQNNPPDLVPEESRIVGHLVDVLSPYDKKNGGPLSIDQIEYVKNRGNLIVEYPGTVAGKVVSFVGMHMDVVPANSKTWNFDPFSLSIDGDMLQGRGTTDCLGHVALLTELMKNLGESKPKLKTTVRCVFIANEENSSHTGVGVDELAKNGFLDSSKTGPLYWVDSADKEPCIGSGGMIPWHLTAKGKLFHSGLPNKAINALELAMDALTEIQTRFYKDYPRDKREEVYGFEIPSTMKPTQWKYTGGGLNQIPGDCTISGDVRLTPFYDIQEMMTKLKAYVADINDNIEKLPTRGPVSKYVLPDENLKGELKIEFDETMSGIACDLESPGYKALYRATKDVLGDAKPFSITGSLPLVKDLQDNGFDVQIMGYGLMDTYHADNEYCKFSDMSDGYRIIATIISILEE